MNFVKLAKYVAIAKELDAIYDRTIVGSFPEVRDFWRTASEFGVVALSKDGARFLEYKDAHLIPTIKARMPKVSV